MAEPPDTHVETATFILLSYARPRNIQRIIDSISQARSCGRIILSNNQPAINIYDHIDGRNDLLDVVQQDRERGAVKRFCIARECDGELFVCIDDDMFMTPQQIDRLVAELINDPSRPHGIWGQLMETENGKARLSRPIHNISCDVSVLNMVYAFTRDHISRFFDLLDRLGIADPEDLGPFDDIVLSFTGARPPKCHDLGPFDICATWNLEGVAIWKQKNFMQRRMRFFLRLQSLVSRDAAMR
jgi:hypothetical protein